MARQLGYTEDQIRALDEVEGSRLFDPPLETVLIYAERMTRDGHTVTDELFERMRTHYDDRKILELTSVVSIANYFNKMTTTLRIDLSGSNQPYDEAEAP